MAAITISIIVERPVAEVFTFVTDARNNALWQASAGLQESLQLPECPVGVGTQITEVWHFMGVKAQVTSEVTAYEPGRRYTRHLISGTSPITQRTLVFEPVATGTQWTTSALVQVDGEYPAESLLIANLEQAIEASMAKAKSLLELPVVDTGR